MSDIFYSGPPKEYQPPLGQQTRTDDNKFLTTEALGGYANLDWLKQQLTTLEKRILFVREGLALELRKAHLTILPEDTKLAAAFKQEWPSDLGAAPSLIPYTWYKDLKTKNTNAAQYIRKRWEEAARGPYGITSFDLNDLTDTILDEVAQVRNFVESYVGTVSDSAEQRSVELFQDWAASALQRADKVQEVFEQSTKVNRLPDEELRTTSGEQARQFQAVFTVKLNNLNQQTEQVKASFKKGFSDYSSPFYNKFYGPALNFRINVGRKIYPSNGPLGAEVHQATESLNANLSYLLVDHLKRNEIFNQKMDLILDSIKERDLYRSYIKQLATIGKILDQKAALATLEPGAFPHDPDLFFIPTEQATPDFSADHNLLDNRDDPLAHAQYLLRDGGTITGDIFVDEGVTIDGVDLDRHRHRGHDVDGTEKIHGEDILDLVTDSIDKNEGVTTPENLRHVASKTYVGSNKQTSVSSLLAWEANPAHTFDVRYTPIVKTASTAVQEEWELQTLYKPGLPVVAAIASNQQFFTYATATALYDYTYATNTNVLIAGAEGVPGDVNGTGAEARFVGIRDIAQDYYGGNIYVVDESHKVKSTTSANSAGHTTPVTISTVYTSAYDIRRIDTQGQHYRNTAYVIEGPLPGGKYRVVKLHDADGSDLAASVKYASTVIPQLSVYNDLIDIAAASNGNVFVLRTSSVVMYDPVTSGISVTDVTQEGALPVAITCDEQGKVFIAYTS